MAVRRQEGLVVGVECRNQQRHADKYLPRNLQREGLVAAAAVRSDWSGRDCSQHRKHAACRLLRLKRLPAVQPEVAAVVPFHYIQTGSRNLAPGSVASIRLLAVPSGLERDTARPVGRWPQWSLGPILLKEPFGSQGNDNAQRCADFL